MKRVYFMRPVGQIGPIKIGCSKLPELRLDTMTIWSPVQLEIVVSVPGTHPQETALHGMFRKHHLHGEWFGASKELLALIDHCVERGELPELPKVVRFPRTRHAGHKTRAGIPARAPRAPRPPRPLSDAKRAEAEAIKATYDSGKTLAETGVIHGVCLNTARRLIAEIGGTIRRKGPRESKKGVADVERAAEMARRYQGGETLQEIGDSFGVTRERVRQLLRKAGVPSLGVRAGVGGHKPAPITDFEREVAAAYSAGDTPLQQLRERFGITANQLAVILLRTKTPKLGLSHWLTRPDDAERTAKAAELYRAGLKTREIAEQIGVKRPEQVYPYLHKAGVRLNRTPATRPESEAA